MLIIMNETIFKSWACQLIGSFTSKSRLIFFTNAVLMGVWHSLNNLVIFNRIDEHWEMCFNLIWHMCSRNASKKYSESKDGEEVPGWRKRQKDQAPWEIR